MTCTSKTCISKTCISKTCISEACNQGVYMYAGEVWARCSSSGLDFRRHGARPLVQQAIKTFSRLRDSRPPQSIQNHTLLNTSCKKLKSCGQLFTEPKYFGSTSHLVFFFNATWEGLFWLVKNSFKVKSLCVCLILISSPVVKVEHKRLSSLLHILWDRRAQWKQIGIQIPYQLKCK